MTSKSGMAAPLFVLAVAWERLGASGRQRLRGREMRLGPVPRHSSVVVSSLLFVVLGAGFIAFDGSNALGGLYAAVGVADLAQNLETGVANLAANSPLLLAVIVGVPIAIFVIAVARRSSQPTHDV